MDSKQVILVRTDLNMPVGKIAAQVAHASMLILLNKMDNERKSGLITRTLYLHDNTPMKHWIQDGSFTKIVLAVPTEDEMMNLHYKAKTSDVPTCVITDEGRTCFNDRATNTCVAIGPSQIDIIDKLTGHLKLLK